MGIRESRSPGDTERPICQEIPDVVKHLPVYTCSLDFLEESSVPNGREGLLHVEEAGKEAAPSRCCPSDVGSEFGYVIGGATIFTEPCLTAGDHSQRLEVKG